VIFEMKEDLDKILNNLESDRSIALNELNGIKMSEEGFEQPKSDYKVKLLQFLNKNNEIALKVTSAKPSSMPEEDEEDDEATLDIEDIREVIRKKRLETKGEV